MKNFCKYALVSLFVLCLVLCSLFYSHNNAQPQPTPTEPQPTPGNPGPVLHPHLMVNGQIYWSTNALPDDLWVRDGFERIGEIKESVSYGEELTEDFQAYDLTEGWDIYGHSGFPEVVYVMRENWMSTVDFQAYDPAESWDIYGYSDSHEVVLMEEDWGFTFCLGDTNGDLLNYDGVVYESLASMSISEFRELEALYGHLDAWVEELPSDAVFLGETVFVGYGRWPRKELDSNRFENPASVYRDGDDPDILYVVEPDDPLVIVNGIEVLYFYPDETEETGKTIFCYIPLPDQPEFDAN